jgi:DNA mismatch repair protein MutS2
MAGEPGVGDRVHVPGLGTGTVRERRGARCVVEIKGLPVVVEVSRVVAVEVSKKPRGKPPGERAAATPAAAEPVPTTTPAATLDLHGRTVAEALDALEASLNDAMLAGRTTLYVIHGRSGGRIKAAVYGRLRQVTSVRTFRVDPRNPGQTIVSL